MELFKPNEVKAAMSLLHKLREKEKELEGLAESLEEKPEKDPDKAWIGISWAMELQLVRDNIQDVEKQIESNVFNF